MNLSPIVTGILSFGKSGKNFHAPFLNIHHGFHLKAVVERSIKSAKKTYPLIKSYDSVDEMFEDTEIQLIVVNTPDHLHFEHAKAALLHGKHVLLEKPATIYPHEIKELYNIADREGKYILVFQNRRWDTDFQSVKAILASGEIGAPVEMHLRYDLLLNEEQIDKLENHGDSPGGDIIYGLGAHVLDQAISLFGQPLGSYKSSSRYNGKKGIIYFNYVLKFKNNITVFVSSNVLATAPQPAYVVRGTKGSFSKVRSDCQEAQLLEGVRPGSEGYAVERTSDKGLLTVADNTGAGIVKDVDAAKSSYMGLFDALYQQITDDIPFPVTREQIKWQIELLSKKDD